MLKLVIVSSVLLIISVVLATPVDNEEERLNKLKTEFTLDDCVKGIQKPSSMGCFAAIPVYHWNHAKQECERQIYGGCQGTRNNFRKLEDCQEVAQAKCSGHPELLPAA